LDDEKLRFAPASAGGPSVSGVCEIDMCADTSAIEAPSRPDDYEWNLSASDPYTKYSCTQNTGQVCSCSGRNKTCVENGVTTNLGPDASCNLDATCSYGTPSGGTVSFNFTATNVIGSLTNGGTFPHTIPTTGAGIITETRSLGNSGDSQTDSATCNYAYNNNPTTQCGGVGEPACPSCGGVGEPACPVCGEPGQPVCPTDCTPGVDCPGDEDGPALPTPEILTFKASRIVNQGTPCTFAWTTKDFNVYQNALCTLGGQPVDLNGTSTFPTTLGNNITKTLSCTTGQATPLVLSQTQTCLVRPTVIMR
jgi:hypothetical protein